MISGFGNFIDGSFIDGLAQLVFWSSAVLLAYTFVGYPLLAWIRSKLNSHPLNQALLNKSRLNKSPLKNAPFEPTLSILVIAHNEARRMRERIENLLALDYPRDLLEIVIASDASTDGTAEVAMDYTLSGIRVIQFQQHRGKPAVLNEVIPQLRGDIVVMMDARQRIEPQALRALVANFTDPRTGAVSGELLLDEDAGNPQTGAGVGFYWRYEKFIRLHESRADSTVGVTGALYALRRKLFRPIPEDTLLDDVLIPMQIVRQGYRVLFEPEARAHDCVAPTAEAELTRKVRTIAGNFQLLFHETWLLNPRLNRLWFQTLSHKFFRLLGPVLLAALLLSNLLLLDLAAYRVLLLLQLLFYTAAMAGHLSRKAPGRPALMNIAYSFCLLNWATVLGFYRFMLGHQQVTWQKAQA
jgi:cellulose synthase/poly-beta-1,6-N-acetylglucosamine synthase-like glycosyltransferase